MPRPVRLTAATLLTAACAACASQPDNIAKQSVSPLQYAQYDCDQVGMELTRVESRASELHGNLKKKADNDTAQAILGTVLFWPALFFLEGGDGPEAQEYAHLRGERDALQEVSVQKRCQVAPAPISPDGPVTLEQASAAGPGIVRIADAP